MKNIDYLDYLRVYACIAVVFMHTSADLLSAASMDINWHLTNGFVCVAFTAVPIFFMISGYLILSSDRTNDIKYLFKHRIPHLLIPLIAWSIMIVVWQLYHVGELGIKYFITELIDALSSPVMNHLWFMYTLIALYVISPLLSGCVRYMECKSTDRYILVLIFVLELYAAIYMVLELVFNQEILQIDLISKLFFLNGYVAVFLLGYFLIKKAETIKINLIFLLIIAIVIISIIILATSYLTEKNELFNQTFQDQSRGWEVFLAVCLVLIFKSVKWRKIPYIIKLISTLSFPIYLMHNLVRNIFAEYGIVANTFCEVVLYTLFNLAICIFVSLTVASVKYTCYFFTGLKFENAKHICNWYSVFSLIKQTYKHNIKNRKVY